MGYVCVWSLISNLKELLIKISIWTNNVLITVKEKV